MKEAEPKNPCASCKDKPCVNNPYNPDQECWKHDTEKQVHFIEQTIEIEKKEADTIEKEVEKKELPKPDFPEETLDESIERRR